MNESDLEKISRGSSSRREKNQKERTERNKGERREERERDERYRFIFALRNKRKKQKTI